MDFQRASIEQQTLLKQQLLAHGGNPAHGYGGFQCGWELDASETRRLLMEGVVIPFSDAAVSLHPLEDRECHANSEALALSRPDYHLMSGFGMGDPTVSGARRWDVRRVHSWVVTNEGMILETTIPRRLYAGFLVHPDKPGAAALAQRLGTLHPPVQAKAPTSAG